MRFFVLFVVLDSFDLSKQRLAEILEIKLPVSAGGRGKRGGDRDLARQIAC
jgi:hypothetical protein